MHRRSLGVAITLLPTLVLAQPTPATRPPSGGRPPAASPANRLSARDEAALDALFRRAYPAGEPGATVLIARGDAVLYRKAFGMADLELRVPMRPENVLHLASITKQFTSVAILMLVEQGKLSMQDPLSKFVDGFPRGNEITIHHLLTHTSGLTSYTNLPAYRTRSREDLEPKDIAETIRGLPLEFTPGEQYAYSNSGYLLLGMIIAKVSGMPYGDFVQKHIFDRLGMKHSSNASNYTLVPNRARGYQFYEGAFEHPDYLSPTMLYAAGSLLSSVDDMLRWQKAIRDNTLISERSKQLAFTNNPLTNGRLSNYGYGWAINEVAGIRSIEHAGGVDGYATSGIYIPSRDLYAIILTNRDDGTGPEGNNIRAVSQLLGAPLVENPPAPLSEAQLTRWTGTYRFDDAVRVISYDKGALFSTRVGGRPLKLVPISETRFRMEDRLATFDFSITDGTRRVLYVDRIIKSAGVESNEKP